ncbi:unnamed protein product [Staurois parvus]|uniref:Uncharacterized protein n=1 Tax=Staurois parvus TaxID=386267 RepID=A0ABN9B0T3_9NEOB|nr:unnamed protein product [Staurois parvus]
MFIFSLDSSVSVIPPPSTSAKTKINRTHQIMVSQLPFRDVKGSWTPLLCI